MQRITISANIARTLAKFTANTETRPNLRGIRFERLGTNYRAIATDGHKMLAAFGEMREGATDFRQSFTLIIDKAVPKSADRLLLDLPAGTLQATTGQQCAEGWSNGEYQTVAQLISDRRGIVGAVPVRLLDHAVYRFPDWQAVFPRQLTARPMQSEKNPKPELAILPSSINPALLAAFTLDHLPQTRIVWSGTGENPEGRALYIEIAGDAECQWAGLIMPMREAERVEAVAEWVHQSLPALTLVEADSAAA